MKRINTTPFQFVSIPGRINYPEHSLTFIIKGTFDLCDGRPAEISEEQLYPTGDVYFPTDIEMTGSVRYESDFAFYKPSADLLLAGHCHAPGEKAVKGCRVGFQVGGFSKELYISGARNWKGKKGFQTISEPEPFVKKELKYENSFGGLGFNQNPVGKSFTEIETEDGKPVRPLPGIQDPKAVIGSANDRPDPVGFGPLGKMWQDRFSKMGTYGDPWLKDRWPWFPRNFDWSYFNAAPKDMQVEGYLKGDESLCLTNLHPKIPVFRSGLPNLRVRCFIKALEGKDKASAAFKEVRLNLDTLWVDMDALKLVLVWRGFIQGSREEDLEPDHIFIMRESLAPGKKSIEDCHDLYRAAVLEDQRQWEEASESENGPAQETIEASNKAPAEKKIQKKISGNIEAINRDVEKAGLKEEIQAINAVILAKMGIDLDKLPKDQKEKLLAGQNRLMDEMMETDPKKRAGSDREKLRARMSDSLSQLGLDLDHLPRLSSRAASEQARMLKELTGGALEDIPRELEQTMAILGAVFSKIGIDLENMDPVIKEAKKYMPSLPEKEDRRDDPEITRRKEKPEPVEKMGKEVLLTRERVKQGAKNRDSFAGRNLSGLDLSELDLSGLDFSGADFKDVNLTHAICTGTLFTGSDLSRADLTQANLDQSDLTRAILDHACLQQVSAVNAVLPKASLRGCVLTDADFEKAAMAGTVLENVTAKDTCFPGADLSGACFFKSDLSGADFSKALLDGSDFEAARLSEACLEGVTCKNANFRQADLTLLRASEKSDFTGSCFCRASGKESMWMNADLEKTDFSYSVMHEAHFTDACLKDANLTASDMRLSRFSRAHLEGADLTYMNGFQAIFEKATLFHTDMRFANLYGAEFLDADIQHLKVEGANLKMTKLHKMAG